MGVLYSTTRTVELENDAPYDAVIDVSDEVVQRLKGLHAKGILFFLFNRNRTNLTFLFSINQKKKNYVTSFM